MDGNNNKPGYKTTEFYVTIATLAITLAAASGKVSQADVPGLNAAAGQAISSIIGLVTAIAYIWSRTKVKSSK
jgi:hypothetical protein